MSYFVTSLSLEKAQIFSLLGKGSIIILVLGEAVACISKMRYYLQTRNVMKCELVTISNFYRKYWNMAIAFVLLLFLKLFYLKSD